MGVDFKKYISCVFLLIFYGSTRYEQILSEPLPSDHLFHNHAASIILETNMKKEKGNVKTRNNMAEALGNGGYFCSCTYQLYHIISKNRKSFSIVIKENGSVSHQV